MGKRIFDLVGACFLLTITSPLFLLTVLAVFFSMGRPILFRQLRPGLNGKPFMFLKFRTMVERRDDQGNLYPDAMRLTGVGRALRRLSLDELPQILNVIRGDMSLVGPRPLLMEYLSLYSHEQSRRHEVRPGITGWAQVNGRNRLTWEQKFAYDVWYADHRTFWLDLRILGLTLLKTLKCEGINERGEATMTKFSGSRHSDG